MTSAVLDEPASSRTDYVRNMSFIGGFFFIFGFVTWLNGTLIPYLRIACELKVWESYFVTFAFYISYTVMAIPSSNLLEHTGMIRGMRIGLVIMALGCLVFIPAALVRTYLLFLLGLFIVGTGLTVLQTAVNPYITLLGPAKSAAQRISIMGLCNKCAGVVAPIVLGTIILNNSDGLIDELKQMQPLERTVRLNILAREVILPYCILSAILFFIAFVIKYAKLPEIKPVMHDHVKVITETKISPLYKNPNLIFGFIAVFCAVGSEVIAGDTIANYGLYHGLRLDIAKNLTSYSLASMVLGYLLGTLTIPKIISQEKAFLYSGFLGLVITALAIAVPGSASIVFIASLNLANALLWPAIWPQALDGLSNDHVSKASAILIMGIAGGAIMPLIYGWASQYTNSQNAYWVLFPCYLFNLYYWLLGNRRSRKYSTQSAFIQHSD